MIYFKNLKISNKFFKKILPYNLISFVLKTMVIHILILNLIFVFCISNKIYVNITLFTQLKIFLNN